MNTNAAARILRAAPVALAVALSVGACGALPCTAGSNNSSAPYSNSSATSNSPGSGSAARPLASSGSSGQSGVSTGSAGGAASGSGAQGGSASGGSTSTAGLSPDDVGQYCKYSGELLDPVIQKDNISLDVDHLTQLRPHTPVQLQPDVELLLADDKAIDNQTRVYAQVKDEVDPAYKRLKDFHDQICVVN
ncbi:MAG: hypothetical protein QOI50_3250 [Pseudonocardiales bacterium]|nr:hypothetical protein [Pseudonocardiales bacterium]